MSESVRQLLERLSPDPWRLGVGFSPDIEDAQGVLFRTDTSVQDKAATLSAWLERYQPCLFGRIAAKRGLLTICLLRESDLLSPDEAIFEKIQSARTDWTREGFLGRKSGFIIATVSEKIANAIPDRSMMDLAVRICSLYLVEEGAIEPDKIYSDEVFLEKPGLRRTTWKWKAGVNYFSSQGDKRWWHDHRIPGGFAFSVNSVGHMVKSGMLAKAFETLDSIVGGAPEDLVSSPVDSLEKALELAMRTIDLAADAVSGKATELLPLPGHTEQLPLPCPVKLPPLLQHKNYCEYSGFYHTDFTLPSNYFRADVRRPEGFQRYSLDFTYLFDNAPGNEDFRTMGTGRPIRADSGPLLQRGTRKDRSFKGATETVQISECARLAMALGGLGK